MQRTILLVEKFANHRVQPTRDGGWGWRWLAWFGLVLALMGLRDFVLPWYPLAFGRPKWEFGTVAATFSGLPLILLGFAGLVAAARALSRRWLILTMGTVLLTFGLVLLAAYGLFLLDIPVTLRTASPVAHFGVAKTIAKTSLVAIASVVACFLGARASVRGTRKKVRG